MSTSCQDVFNRAIGLSDANQAFASLGVPEILWRLNYAQGQLFTRLAQENRFFWARKDSIVSNAAVSSRVLDLSTLVPAVERLLDQGLRLPDGTPLNIVDFQDQDAELAPRAYAIGTSLYEVSNEWGPGGAITFSIVYVYRPADLQLNGDLTQLVTVPDRFTSWLDLDLGIYLSGKDAGRAQLDPQELPRLTAMQEAVYQDILQYVDHVVGPAIRRFTLPVSAKGEKA